MHRMRGENYFNPLPPRGGRLIRLRRPTGAIRFQPTPSSRRETPGLLHIGDVIGISTHSLLAEGDVCDRRRKVLGDISIHSLLAEGDVIIVSSMDIRHISIHSLLAEGDGRRRSRSRPGRHFNPLPPRGGRPWQHRRNHVAADISIHSLLAEGDLGIKAVKAIGVYFNPLPPRGGRPWQHRRNHVAADISIHSLLAEGDVHIDPTLTYAELISIHSLLAEGDFCAARCSRKSVRFQSTPSSRRETAATLAATEAATISIHSLLAEGDQALRAIG